MSERSTPPLVLPYAGVQPQIELPLAGSASGSAVLGRVRLGRGAMLGPFSVLRGDGHHIVAGRDLHLGARATVHIAHDRYPALIGDQVTVGPNAVVHACTVGDRCVIEDDVAILDAALIGADSIVTVGSIVFPRTVLPAGFVCSGAPAVPVRPVGPGELDAARERLRSTPAGSGSWAPCPAPAHNDEIGAGAYVAATAQVTGDMRIGPQASVWFGCDIDAVAHPVHIGPGANIQDNTLVRALGAPVSIGADTTIGHNVMLQDCRIGERVLIGMSSRLAGGTLVADDVFLAAGATTEAGQVLHSGWLWGGRPARPLAPLDARKRALMTQAVSSYRDYAVEFAAAQADTLTCLRSSPSQSTGE